MFNNPELNYLKKRTVNESPLRKNEQMYYDKFIEGVSEDESSPRDVELKEAIRRKRLYKRSCEDMKSFRSSLGDLKVQGDIAKVIRAREGEGQKDKNYRSEIVENLLLEQAENNDWFEGASIYETTEYDDRFNHTDFVLEWKDEENENDSIKVAVDATVAENPEILEKKSAYIKKGLDAGSLAKIDYFESDFSEKKGKLVNVPKIVMMLSQDSLEKICEAAIQKGRTSAFKEDKVQLVFLMEAIDQLRAQLGYIELKGLKNKEKIERVLSKFEEVLENKKSSLGELITKRAEDEYLSITKTAISLF